MTISCINGCNDFSHLCRSCNLSFTVGYLSCFWIIWTCLICCLILGRDNDSFIDYFQAKNVSSCHRINVGISKLHLYPKPSVDKVLVWYYLDVTTSLVFDVGHKTLSCSLNVHLDSHIISLVAIICWRQLESVLFIVV